MNTVQLIGRMVRDAELGTSKNGTNYTGFTLAVDRYVKNGENTADFIRCKAFNKTAETITRNLHKGSQFGVEGSIQTGSYQDKDGKTVFTTDVLVRNITFVSGGNQQNQNQSQQNNQQQNNSQGFKDPFAPSGNAIDISDNDLPF
ncbi:single-stranded DNA-binding protein [Holzapfeliella sp. He02]|uniref:Single-stranded DNA-binding protein n=1 Tax=Holzapfeliella saturejae TaxID=3082953 RepID=A0ABU8SHD5_9LACO